MLSNSASFVLPTTPSTYSDFSTETNATYEIVTPAPKGNITIKKTLLNTDPLIAGESSVTYSIVVTNNGPSQVTIAATDLFTGPLPDGQWACTDGIGGTCTNGSYSGFGDLLNYELQLDVGGQVTFITNGTLEDPTQTSFTNTFSVSGTYGTTLIGE